MICPFDKIIHTSIGFDAVRSEDFRNLFAIHCPDVVLLVAALLFAGYFRINENRIERCATPLPGEQQAASL